MALIVIAQFQIWHETHSLFCGLKLVGLTKSFQMSMHNNCYYLSICNGIVWITVLSQCFSIIHECYRDMLAKTIDREFKAVKTRLQTACLKLDEILVKLNTMKWKTTVVFNTYKR